MDKEHEEYAEYAEYAVEVENLVKSYGKDKILKGITFQVKKGIIFGILGPNGAGKTTLLRILSTLLRYDDGKVRILGYDVPEDMEKVRTMIGFVPENFVFYDKLTVYENLKTFYLFYERNSEKNLEKDVEIILRNFGMWSKRNEISSRLSRGMKQRLNVARSLVNDPEIILLDEPFLSLDAYSVRDLRNVLLKEKEKGKTIILTSHLIDEMVRICDEVMVMKDGRIVEKGKVEEIMRRHGGKNFEDLFLELTYGE